MRPTSGVPTQTARDLLARARAKHKISLKGPRPVIRSLEPSTARWGRTIVISGEFPPGALRVMLRWRDRVVQLEHHAAHDTRLEAMLPPAPDNAPRRATAELFVAAANASASCGIALTTEDAPMRRVNA